MTDEEVFQKALSKYHKGVWMKAFKENKFDFEKALRELFYDGVKHGENKRQDEINEGALAWLKEVKDAARKGWYAGWDAAEHVDPFEAIDRGKELIDETLENWIKGKEK